VSDSYHHGDLRAAALRRAVEIIDAGGPESLTIRSLAADLGVSHTAPRHHFGDRAGVLSAVAAEGFRLLGQLLVTTRESGGSFLDAGVAYVEFALAHPAHFRVMFAPAGLNHDDAELAAAKQAVFAELRDGVDAMAARGQIEDAAAAVIAGWAIVHGIATLALTGNLDDAKLRDLVAGGDLIGITRRSAGMLYSK
jgi:AcrR family transcriptional regulator